MGEAIEAIEVMQEITDAQARRRIEAAQVAGHAILTQLWEARTALADLKAELAMLTNSMPAHKSDPVWKAFHYLESNLLPRTN